MSREADDIRRAGADAAYCIRTLEDKVYQLETELERVKERLRVAEADNAHYERELAARDDGR